MNCFDFYKYLVFNKIQTQFTTLPECAYSQHHTSQNVVLSISCEVESEQRNTPFTI